MIENHLYRFNNNFFSLSLLFFVCFVFFVGNSFSQTTEQIKYYSERIELGTEDVKRNALYDLRNFKTESASRIALPALKDSSEIIRATATHSVIYLPKDESAQYLLPLLNDISKFVRRETAYALGKVGSPSTINDLIFHLRIKKESDEVKTACAVALGQIGDPNVVPFLTRVLQMKRKKKDDFLRRAATRAIGNIAMHLQRDEKPVVTPESFLPEKFKELKSPKYRSLLESFPAFTRANGKLMTILQDKRETDDVSREAAFALGEIGDSSSINIIKANLNAEDYYLAEICKESLRKIYQNVNLVNSDG